jgi:hypothetical protein
MFHDRLQTQSEKGNYDVLRLSQENKRVDGIPY